ncbi:MAG: hypothetical protein ACLUN9_17405 [Enterocloster aldenensis]
MLKAIKIKEDVVEVKNIKRILIEDGFVDIEYDDIKPYLVKKSIKLLAKFKDVEFILGE